MAVVFQEYGRSLLPVDDACSDNVDLPLETEEAAQGPAAGAGRPRRWPRSGWTVTRTAYPWQLSGGMQQRVAIARAVAYEPRVLLMDEPFAAVDAQTRADLEDLIRDLWHKLGVTILFVTHDIDEAVYLGQRVIMLSSSPTVVQDELTIDLPAERDQLHTRADAEFTRLRTHVYEQIQAAKRNAATEVAR